MILLMILFMNDNKIMSDRDAIISNEVFMYYLSASEVFVLPECDVFWYAVHMVIYCF